MNTNPIASELSYLVWLKQQQENGKRDVPVVKADAEKPARFDVAAVTDKRGYRRDFKVLWS